MGLGALVVVGVLFAAGFYLPRRLKIHAGGSKASLPSQPSSGAEKAPQPAAPHTPPAAADNSTAVPTPVPGEPTPESAEKSKRGGRKSDGAGGSQAISAEASRQQAAAEEQAKAAAAAAALAAAELEEAEHQEDQMTSRASSVSQSLDNLKRAQSGQGYGLRGDVVSAEQRMQTYMSKAQAALQRQDGANAKKYFEQADREITFLEKFLGH
jgi:hypothetical protein